MDAISDRFPSATPLPRGDMIPLLIFCSKDREERSGEVTHRQRAGEQPSAAIITAEAFTLQYLSLSLTFSVAMRAAAGCGIALERETVRVFSLTPAPSAASMGCQESII